MYFAYLLKSKNHNRHYIGCTGSLNDRIKRHNMGEVSSAKAYIPWDLIGYEEYPTLAEARKREYYLKSLKNPKYVKAIFNENN